MKRKEFLRLAAPAFLLLANGDILRANTATDWEELRKKRRLRFVVASDGHYGQKGTDYEAFFQTLVTRSNEEHGRDSFDFCMINGDIIHDDRTHFPAAKRALDGLRPKYYVSQGNHDHVNAADWQSIWQMPVNLDFRMRRNSFLIATTSNEQGTYLCPDTAWFEERLQAHSRQDNVFIFLHINPGKLTKYGVDCKELLELFAKHKNIRAVFNGHDHDEEGIKMHNGIPYVFDAHFGGDWGTPYRGFRVVELMADHSVLTYIMDPVNQLKKDRIEHSLITH